MSSKKIPKRILDGIVVEFTEPKVNNPESYSKVRTIYKLSDVTLRTERFQSEVYVPPYNESNLFDNAVFDIAIFE